DSPMGMTVSLKVPHNEEPNNLATPALRNATVTLPQGVSINPSEANGLQGCAPAQIKLHSEAAPACPNASQIGKLELSTPLLPEPLSGRIYLSSEHSGNVFHMFLVIEGQGVLIKLEGAVEANEMSGRLVTTFKENPQLPFSELKMTFYGAGEAALASPQQCGAYTATSALEPWSQEGAAMELGHPIATPAPFSEFKIDQLCGGGFAPGFTAGTSNPVAASYSPFSVTFTRKDGEQDLAGVSLTLPRGLTGKLAGVEECATAQINAARSASGKAEQEHPSCPAGSEVGTVETGAGVGENPFFLGGNVYLTGPYNGAPFGLVEIVPVVAGPFDLGTVVVRQTINIDPRTAQVSVKSDPFPTIIDGIPLRIRTVHVEVNRPEFMLNPTSCEATQITGTLLSTAGTQVAESSRFQDGDCANLPFNPTLTAETHAHHTRKDGSFLKVTIVSKRGEANLAKVKVTLPKKLPADLNTLNESCTEAQFDANPAGCPKASFVGTAVVHTPLLASPLTGPAIYVSHGHAKFPNLALVLQGEGVTIIQEGTTNISKGFTTSSFEAVPDVPVSSIELTLPEHEDPALGGNGGNLCTTTVVKHMKKRVKGKVVKRKRKLTKRLTLDMPTTITGQNGAVETRTTKLNVSGCAAKASGHGKGKGHGKPNGHGKRKGHGKGGAAHGEAKGHTKGRHAATGQKHTSASGKGKHRH
ncbi:MAG: hypothetical protein ACYC0H_21550, partial [Solirubrobacteraceae bacterium]